MFRNSIIFILLTLAGTAFSQSVTPQDGNYVAEKMPWNSSFLPTTKDQLVHGENYHGYPGPLPKLYRALGLDHTHPGIDNELLYFVNREAPNWWGICNGWAVSAINFDEPTGLVVNGIKFLPGDLKALLTSIHKDNKVTFFGSTNGISAKTFEDVLFSKVAQDKSSLVFDVDISEETWNFPVVGFSRQSQENGEWTEVTVTVEYPWLSPLDDVVDFPQTYGWDYTYRYKTASGLEYEWTGASQFDHPQRAWVPREPFLRDQWLLNANHFYDIELYNELTRLSQAEDHMADVYEPNQTAASAYKLTSEFVLGSLLEGDEDFFELVLGPGEAFNLEFEVYDGQEVDLSVLDGEGNLIASETNIMTYDFPMVADGDGGSYFIRLKRKEDAYLESFYKLQHPEDVSSFEFFSGPDSVDQNAHLLAMNVTDGPVAVTSFNYRDYAVAPFGAQAFDDFSQTRRFRSSGKTVWAEARVDGKEIEKKYHRDHALKMPYFIPHFTFRNGWKTGLDIRTDLLTQETTLQLFDTSGNLLHQVAVPFGQNHHYQGSLDELLPAGLLAQGAYFTLETGPGNSLKGYAHFSIGANDPVKIDIDGAPRIGELLVFDLKTPTEGGTGLAVVNSAKVANQIMYSLENGDGDVLAQGDFMLNPGEKWMTTPAALNGALDAQSVLYLHAQYPVEGLVIQFRSKPYLLYGHRLLSVQSDRIMETVVSVPEDRNLSSYLFFSPHSGSTRVLFEGYSTDGTLQGRFNPDSSALREGRVLWSGTSKVLSHGANIKDLDAISHFRVIPQKPIYMLEILGAPSAKVPHVISLVNLFDNP